ncbi:elongation factor P--(R)-beta-lysine ligase [Marinobacter nanhaiticus D15-8W]|uniref:EF-P lysine aminoacylase GenX n=1 Tax=Marinobacter nanhaiticus D15-8W TaxID=626887 RepID=N6VZI0_9GAMM|nr:EF-P lysine aminoacylase EpmA [Marinobacter nanhaiticus]ENO13294.1 EF-P lysine aminoacylase GenX [Marinobacter nanhaiticus D15-8W]BES70659.1 elongation factor P--(R)-beta-lysine ligase [Marinobacter nanhaiticus D15-8W]
MTQEPGWRPTAALAAQRERAALLAYLRQFFEARDVLEVETPLLARRGVSDLHLDCVPAELAAVSGYAGGRVYLQTSPEYHMKRLLAAGSGAIYQVFRAFRDGERGRRHNPEFSLLEWYRPGFDDQALMDEVSDLVCGWLRIPAPERMTYRQAFLQHAGLDPFSISLEALRRQVGEQAGDPAFAGKLDRDGCLDFILTHTIEPAFESRPAVFIHDYPASQAALARTREAAGHPVAHRFELYLYGVELCNGYWELTDAEEQRRRFEQDNALRRLHGKPEMPADERLLEALASGMPDCAGVALGLDRLLMCRLGTRDIQDVIAFPIERA